MTESDQETNPYAPSSLPTEELVQPLDFFGSEQSLGKVAAGLNLVYWGILMILLAIVAMMLLIPFGIAGGAGMGPLGIIMLGLGLMMIAGVVVGVIGRVFCLSVPETSGARGFIMAAVALDVLAILIMIGSWLSPAVDAASGLTNLLTLISAIFFVLFLGKVSASINRPDLQERARGVLLMGALLFFVFISAVIGAIILGPLVAIAGLVALVLGLFMFLRYIRLIVDVRQAILVS